VLIRRDLKLRYADSMLGYVWTVLEPLMMGSIYWFVFTIIFQRSVGAEPYIIFLLAGLLPWMWFTNGLNEGIRSLTSQRRLIASTSLPRQIWVLRSTGAKGVEFLLSLPVLVVFALVYRPEIDAQLVLFPLGILIQLMLLIGLALLLAPITMLVRDVEPLVRVGTRALFYASPIIYGLGDVLVTSLPPFVIGLYTLNPLTGILECYRAGLFPGPVHWGSVLAAALIAVLTLVVGWIVFARMERQVLKEI
jgi:ABC-2 type transport system permease protein